MLNNLLGLNPFEPTPIQQIASRIIYILQQHPSPTTFHLQIQFKYAEMIQFCQSNFYNQSLNFNNVSMSSDVKKKVFDMCAYYVMEQNDLHLETLKKLSRVNIVMLNPLGRRVYQIYGGFNEHVHRKFYKMREFLIHLCKQNQQNIVTNLNFFAQIQSSFANRTFTLLNSSQIRFDVNVREGEHAGRYSYQVGKGWTRTNKLGLIKEQFDLLICQKAFRLGIKKQQQTPVTFQQFAQVLNNMKGGVFMRFKRALRVLKNKQVEIALSEIYQPEQQRRNQCLQDLKDMLNLQPQILDEFCQNVFQEFYMYQPKPNQIQNFADSVIKYQIQSQFTEEGVNKLRQFHKNNNFNGLCKYIQTSLFDLYALVWTDHNVKKRQPKVMSQMIKEKGLQLKFPESRLENQFGNYMHDIVYQYMTTTQ